MSKRLMAILQTSQQASSQNTRLGTNENKADNGKPMQTARGAQTHTESNSQAIRVAGERWHGQNGPSQRCTARASQMSTTCDSSTRSANKTKKKSHNEAKTHDQTDANCTWP